MRRFIPILHSMTVPAKYLKELLMQLLKERYIKLQKFLVASKNTSGANLGWCAYVDEYKNGSSSVRYSPSFISSISDGVNMEDNSTS